MASSIARLLERWGQDLGEAGRVLDSARQRAITRAGIDTASRSPIMAPWSIYPFSPVDCAALICDLLVFETTVSVQALVESLERAGLTDEVLLEPANGQLGGDMGVVRAHWRDRSMIWHAFGLNLLLYELAEPDTLARVTGEALRMNNPPREPVMVYANEAGIWLPKLTGTSARHKGTG